MLGDGQADVEADEVGEPEGAHGVAVAEDHALVDVGGAGHALLQHADGLQPEADAEPAGGEAGRVADLDALLAQPGDPAAGVVDRRRGGALADDELDEGRERHRVEEVHAEEPLRPAERRRQLGDRQRAGVAGQQRPRRDDLLGRGQQVALGGGDLGDRLHHELDVEGGVEAGDRAEPADAGLDLAGGGAFAAGQPVGDAGPGPRGGVAVGLDDHDRTARLQQHLGDARPHRAAADHGGPAARSLLITHGRGC